uniref:Neuropeptide NPF-2 n=1 Tax=Leptinotarsa decemlineata TaxID=7539 RepID=NPF2_LEPDE|nr:RecName: Full=Neuropeptide NPF-2; Short=Led-NPF-2; AltName: Full=Short neuropeptide F II [Leptinotarsa decemlineata]
APSLRLRF